MEFSQKKPASYFKTLPVEIVKSPTGLAKIPNSRFPTIAPLGPGAYKSVYERAGFDVYKPGSQMVPGSPITDKSPQARSVSTANLPSHSGVSYVMKTPNKSNNSLQQRNVSSPIASRKALGSSGNPGLSIDAKLANKGIGRVPPNGLVTPAPSTSTLPSISPVESWSTAAHSTTSSRFEYQRKSIHSVQSAAALSRTSTESFDSAESELANTPAVVGHEQAHSVMDPYITTRSAGSSNDITSVMEGTPLSHTVVADSSFASTGSVSSVKYTPEHELNLSPSASEASDDELNLSEQDEEEDDDDDLNLSSEDEHISSGDENISSDEKYDDHSLRSGVLSPFAIRGDSTMGSPSSASSMRVSPVNLRLQSTSPIPLVPLLPKQEVVIPMVTISPPADQPSGLGPPQLGVNSSLDRASSIYSVDEPEKEEFDDSAEESTSEMTSSAFEDVEKELEDLSMNSTPTRLEKADAQNRSLDLLTSQIHSTNSSQDNDPHPVHIHRNEHSFDFTPSTEPLGSTSPLRFSKPIQFTHEAPKHAPGTGSCRNCSLTVSSKPIYSKSGELSGQWHRECFTCTLCDIRFNKNIPCFVLKDQPYCEFHYHLSNDSLCQVCGRGIIGECLENDAGGRYHLDCLSCTRCSTRIDEDYMSIDGKVYCEPCAMDFVGVASSNMERRRTRLFFI